MSTTVRILTALLAAAIAALGTVGTLYWNIRAQPKYAEVAFPPPVAPKHGLTCTTILGKPCAVMHRVEAGYTYIQLDNGRLVRFKN